MSTHHLEGLEQLISIDELSEYLGVPVKTIYDWRLTGHGPYACAPGLLNLVVHVLAWDALKVGWLAVGVILRSIVGFARQSVGRAWQVPQPTS